MTEDQRLLAKVHRTATIDDTVQVYGDCTKLQIGAHSRIDAFCVLTVGEKGLWIGDHVHVGAGAYIFGAHGKVRIGRCCSISPRAMLFTASDCMTLPGLIGACVPKELRVPVKVGDVVMEDGSAVGAGSIILPGVKLGKGAVAGAMTVVGEDVPDWVVLSSGMRWHGVMVAQRQPVEIPDAKNR